jgi:hypothetical protein
MNPQSSTHATSTRLAVLEDWRPQITGRVDSHARRLRSLETSLARVVGAAAAGSVLGGALVQIIVTKIGG